ncbi:hypothetical protein [Arthrobacter sp. G119Y2]|uniref:hypothetical protein n=1 Tax=Arthrobacter sp. G119Y2 TaxID=3134965 RepID=UPI00311A4EF1
MTEPSTNQRDDLAPNLVTVTLSPEAEDRTVYLPATDQCNEMVRDLAAAYGDLGTATSADVEAAAALLAAGYRKPRTITTVEELDTLPVEAVVRSHVGVVWEKGEFPDEPEFPFWTTPGTNHEYPASHISLPATVLWEPEAEATR